MENVSLTLTANEAMLPAIGLASGLWCYKEGQEITICDNSFRNVTINANKNVTGKTDILHGWEWSDRQDGIVATNNVMENITNNLVYPA